MIIFLGIFICCKSLLIASLASDDAGTVGCVLLDVAWDDVVDNPSLSYFSIYSSKMTLIVSLIILSSLDSSKLFKFKRNAPVKRIISSKLPNIWFLKLKIKLINSFLISFVI